MNNNIVNNKIKEAIVKTIAFFDLFDYPLTDWEIWKLGYWDIKMLDIRPRPASLTGVGYCDIRSILDNGKLNNIIESKNGFYFLAGREKIIKTKMARYNYSNKKFKRAMLVVRIFKFIPWIKMIAVGNIIGAHNLKDESDIDFFIITEQGRIWITRFFCAGFMKLLGMRPRPGNEQDKICLSFYVSEEALDLRGLMLGDDMQIGSTALRDYGAVGCFDIYFIYWLAGLALIYDTSGVYEKFIRANNWIKGCLPNWRPAKLVKRRNSGQDFSSFYHDLIDLLFGGLEKDVKKLQLKKLPSGLKDLMNKDTRVVINDQVLKLYAKDRREEYFRKWQEKLVEIEMAGWMLK